MPCIMTKMTSGTVSMLSSSSEAATKAAMLISFLTSPINHWIINICHGNKQTEISLPFQPILSKMLLGKSSRCLTRSVTVITYSCFVNCKNRISTPPPLHINHFGKPQAPSFKVTLAHTTILCQIHNVSIVQVLLTFSAV